MTLLTSFKIHSAMNLLTEPDEVVTQYQARVMTVYRIVLGFFVSLEILERRRFLQHFHNFPFCPHGWVEFRGLNCAIIFWSFQLPWMWSRRTFWDHYIWLKLQYLLYSGPAQILSHEFCIMICKEFLFFTKKQLYSFFLFILYLTFAFA